MGRVYAELSVLRAVLGRDVSCRVTDEKLPVDLDDDRREKSEDYETKIN
jgi:hypothetical protein